jgi:predicted transcriptional regulator
MSAATVKDEARKIVEGLPDDATWEELIYRLYVREGIEQGLSDADAGRTVDTATVRAELGLVP